MMKRCQFIFSDLQAWIVRVKLYLDTGPDHTAVFQLQTPDQIDCEVQTLSELLERTRNLPVVLPKRAFFFSALEKMKAEAIALRQVQSHANCTDPVQIENVVARAESLDFPPILTADLIERTATLKVQLPLVTAMRFIDSDASLEEMEALLLCVNDLKWIEELEGASLSRALQQKVERTRKEDENVGTSLVLVREKVRTGAVQIGWLLSSIFIGAYLFIMQQMRASHSPKRNIRAGSHSKGLDCSFTWEEHHRTVFPAWIWLQPLGRLRSAP